MLQQTFIPLLKSMVQSKVTVLNPGSNVCSNKLFIPLLKFMLQPKVTYLICSSNVCSKNVYTSKMFTPMKTFKVSPRLKFTFKATTTKNFNSSSNLCWNQYFFMVTRIPVFWSHVPPTPITIFNF